MVNIVVENKLSLLERLRPELVTPFLRNFVTRGETAEASHIKFAIPLAVS